MTTTTSTLDRALQITSSIFAEINHLECLYKGKWQTAWSLYNLVHIRFSIPFSEHREKLLHSPELRLADFPSGARDSVFIAAKLRGIPVIRPTCANRTRSLLDSGLQFCFHSFFLLYSIFSILIFRLRKGTRIALWTGDFVDKQSRADFRIGPLLEKLGKVGIPSIELVRQNAFGFGRTFCNLLRRRRPAVYYESFFYFFARRHNVNLRSPKDQLSAVVLSHYRHKLSALHSQIGMSEFLFALLDTKAFLSWEFSDRQAPLLIAAKERNLRTIGFMHGAGMRNYMAHEFMSEFTSPYKIGPDYFGVWSPWWKSYYDTHSRIYGRVEVGGPLRRETIRAASTPARANAENPSLPTVLWISEPLVEVEQVLDYMDWLKENTKLHIKKRPSTTDIFYNSLVCRYPRFKDVPFLDGNILEAISRADVVVGSHSTAVLDACLAHKPFVLVKTPKWGDYFELGDISKPYKIFVSNIDELEKCIDCILNSLPECIEFLFEIENRFYGKSNQDGCAWVIKKIIE